MCKINNLNISQVTEKLLMMLKKWFQNLDSVLNEKEKNSSTYSKRN